MTLIDEVRALRLPEGSFIIVGSGILEALGIRDAADVDIIVRSDLMVRFVDESWRPAVGGHGKMVLISGRFELSATWSTSEGEMSLDDLLPGSVSIEGIRFIGLSRLLAWKKAMSRPKDIADIALIGDYLTKNVHQKTIEEPGS